MEGNQGQDTLEGGDGDDALDGGEGTNVLRGDDYFVIGKRCPDYILVL